MFDYRVFDYITDTPLDDIRGTKLYKHYAQPVHNIRKNRSTYIISS